MKEGYERFKHKFSSMKKENKWKLSTGTVVENRLCKFGMDVNTSSKYLLNLILIKHCHCYGLALTCTVTSQSNARFKIETKDKVIY